MEKKKPKKPYNSFVKYTGLGIQMAVVIVLGHYLGEYIDTRTNTQNEVFAKLFTLLAVFLSTVMVIRQVIKDSN